jgi:predicted DNA-binding antitoxin AbrB/MazE fold protein
MMMPILVEITYEDGMLKTSSIQLKSGENNDTAKSICYWRKKSIDPNRY